MPPQNSISFVGLTKAQFVDRYWFTPLQMVRVRNADWHINRDTGVRSSQDFIFMSEGRRFMVPANGEEEYVGPIANAYLKGISSALAQADNRFEALADPMYVAEYYNKLIVTVRDLAPEYNPVSIEQLHAQQAAADLPPWMQQNPPQPATQNAPVPPWEQTVAQPVIAPSIPPAQPPSLPVHPVQPQPTGVTKGFQGTKLSESDSKQFEYNGLTFKMVTAAEGKTYFKNDQEIDVVTYNKAASMI